MVFILFPVKRCVDRCVCSLQRRYRISWFESNIIKTRLLAATFFVVRVAVFTRGGLSRHHQWTWPRLQARRCEAKKTYPAFFFIGIRCTWTSPSRRIVWRCSLGMSAEIVLPFEALIRIVNSCGMVVNCSKQASLLPVPVTLKHNIIGVTEAY